MTRQIESTPHVPIQGSVHFWFVQDLSWGHSVFITHSGLHPGGLPMYFGRQEQTAC